MNTDKVTLTEGEAVHQPAWASGLCEQQQYVVVHLDDGVDTFLNHVVIIDHLQDYLRGEPE